MASLAAQVPGDQLTVVHPRSLTRAGRQWICGRPIFPRYQTYPRVILRREGHLPTLRYLLAQRVAWCAFAAAPTTLREPRPAPTPASRSSHTGQPGGALPTCRSLRTKRFQSRCEPEGGAARGAEGRCQAAGRCSAAARPLSLQPPAVYPRPHLISAPRCSSQGDGLPGVRCGCAPCPHTERCRPGPPFLAASKPRGLPGAGSGRERASRRRRGVSETLPHSHAGPPASAGKTTLLNHILKLKQNRRVAVVENEASITGGRSRRGVPWRAGSAGSRAVPPRGP